MTTLKQAIQLKDHALVVEAICWTIGAGYRGHERLSGAAQYLDHKRQHRLADELNRLFWERGE